MRTVMGGLALVVFLHPAGDGAAAASGPKLVVRDVQAKGATAAEAATLSSSMCSAFARARRFSVLCGEDLRAMLEFAAMAQALDACSGEGCLKGLRAALGARFMVSATLKKSELYVLSVSAFDGKTGEVVGRTEIEGEDIDGLQADVGEVAGVLLQKLRQRAQSSLKKGG